MICDKLARVPLAHLPTPLEEAERLGAVLNGPRLFIKREDLSGLCAGGNKTRLMDYVMGDVLAQGCDVMIGSAALQSNKLREVAAAGNRLGLRSILLLQADPPQEPPQGNLLLYHLLGAEVRYLGAEARKGPGVLEAQQALAEELRAEGHRVVVLDRSLSYGAVASAAYVAAAEELAGQFEALGVTPSALYVTSGSGMTTAGLVLGLKHLGCATRVVGVCVSWDAEKVGREIVDYGERAAKLLGIATRISTADFTLLGEYLEPGYGRMTPPIRAAVHLVASTTGMVLDPVYNGKTMSALLDRIRRGLHGPEETVVFVNTGGGPAIYAYNQELLAED